MNSNEPKAWLDSGQRTMRWLASHLREDGTWRESDDCGAYFKSIPAFISYGMLGEAQRCTNQIAARFLTANGDVRNSTGQKSSDAVYELHADTYFDYLVAIGAWRLGRYDVALPVVNHLAGRQIEQTGGFLIQRRGTDPLEQQDIFSTAGGTIAMLTAGRLEPAMRGAQWLVKLLRSQAQSPTFHVRTDGKGNLIREFAIQEQKRYQVDPSRNDQMYVMPGTAAAALAIAYQASGREEFLDAAKQYLDRWTADWIFQASVQSCKHGWAAGLLWSITSDPRYRHMIERAANSLIAMQNQEGHWPFADLSWGFRYAFNAELAHWLAEYARLSQPSLSQQDKSE